MSYKIFKIKQVNIKIRNYLRETKNQKQDLDISFINFNCLITIFINYILGNFASMLSNIAVNSQPLPRPQSANIPKRIYTNSSQYTLDNLQNCQSSFLNHEKIILPVKEYSNKFLRESKQKQDSIFNSYNHSIFKPKKSFVYNRKQLKYRKPCQAKPLPNKENQTRSIKTQASFLQSNHEPYERDKSIRNANTPMERCFSTPNNKERISASRALELFSRVFKNQNIERLKIRKQIISRQMDVQVKQVKLQDKEKEKQKDRHEKIQKLSTLKNKKLHFHGGILERTKKENKSLFLDEDNFQLAGW